MVPHKTLHNFPMASCQSAQLPLDPHSHLTIRTYEKQQKVNEGFSWCTSCLSICAASEILGNSCIAVQVHYLFWAHEPSHGLYEASWCPTRLSTISRWPAVNQRSHLSIRTVISQFTQLHLISDGEVGRSVVSFCTVRYATRP